jgi:hypothetical protein
MWKAPKKATGAKKKQQPDPAIDAKVDAWCLSYYHAADKASGATPGNRDAEGIEPIAKVRKDLAALAANVRRILDAAEEALANPTAPGALEALDAAWELTRDGIDRKGALATIGYMTTAIAARGRLPEEERQRIAEEAIAREVRR